MFKEGENFHVPTLYCIRGDILINEGALIERVHLNNLHLATCGFRKTDITTQDWAIEIGSRYWCSNSDRDPVRKWFKVEYNLVAYCSKQDLTGPVEEIPIMFPEQNMGQNSSLAVIWTLLLFKWSQLKIPRGPKNKTSHLRKKAILNL